MKIYKVTETDHYGYSVDPKYFLNKKKAYEEYRALIKKAWNHPDLASRDDLDGEKPIKELEDCLKDSGILNQVIVSIWNECNTPEGHWSDIISYGIEIREIEVVV
ncbi:hypothetical protein [Brevibacillus borstelensis]|uniref:hypothetical protein n=1 Tax=Brevibacillus borstelensis TaxID=45462 RepID=UPI0004F342E5|nr:hypothetical protein [Brevibacillus borstelensis]KKX52465.1 hypothetical protein X546_24970 [Brevibacillus borstelensis cifa_chp40]